MLNKLTSGALVTLCFVAVFLSGCAHVKTVEREGTPLSLPVVESFHLNDPEPPAIVDQELEVIPPEAMPLVNKWIDYFQGRGRPHMERYLARSTRYSKLMKRILRQNGLPEDLMYIALIESGFSHKATSRAAAVGYWQFIRGTGRRYGLEINSMVDERRDPVMATQAAAEYFKGLYSMFGSWFLSMASYNVGENRVKKEITRAMTRDFWELVRKKRLPKETLNYVPKFIAAKMIGQDPAKYGFVDIDYLDPIEFDQVKVERAVNLKLMAEKMNLDYDDFKLLNPKFKGEIAPVKGRVLELRIPVGQGTIALAAANDSFVDKVEFVADAGEVDVYKVRSGDSLSTIARKFRTTIGWLRDNNDLKKGRKLRVGQRIFVPERGPGKTLVAREEAKDKVKTATPAPGPKVAVNNEPDEKAEKSPEIVTAKGVFYIVQKGDTLSEIADQYNSTVDELRKMNKIRRGKKLQIGMKLKVPKDEGLPSEPSSDARAIERNENRAVATASGITSSSAESSDQNARKKKRTVKGPKKITRYHIIKRGENLTQIAQKYQVSLQELQEANRFDRGARLLIGAKILIP